MTSRSKRLVILFTRLFGVHDMRNPIITPGQKFNRLTAVAFSHFSKRGKPYWLFLCSCKAEHVACVYSVRSGHTKSCGCWQRDAVTTHGLHDHPLYHTFSGMHSRCYNPSYHNFKDYGGRGIVVDPRWHDIATFISDIGEIPDGMSLDRINNDGPYSPENTRLSTAQEQANNRRSNVIVEYQGQNMPLKQATKLAGLNYQTVWQRLRKGWPIERAFNRPVGRWA